MKATRLLLLALVLLVTACAGLFGESRREGVSSSLVQYLYPEGEKPPAQGQIPNPGTAAQCRPRLRPAGERASRPCPKRNG